MQGTGEPSPHSPCTDLFPLLPSILLFLMAFLLGQCLKLSGDDHGYYLGSRTELKDRAGLNLSSQAAQALRSRGHTHFPYPPPPTSPSPTSRPPPPPPAPPQAATALSASSQQYWAHKTRKMVSRIFTWDPCTCQIQQGLLSFRVSEPLKLAKLCM